MSRSGCRCDEVLAPRHATWPQGQAMRAREGAGIGPAWPVLKDRIAPLDLALDRPAGLVQARNVATE